MATPATPEVHRRGADFSDLKVVYSTNNIKIWTLKTATMFVLIFLSLTSLASGNRWQLSSESFCPMDRIQKTGNCSFRMECHNIIRGVGLPNNCLESSNDPASIDITLTGDIDRFENVYTDQDIAFLSLITTLKIHSNLPKTRLAILKNMPRLERLHLSNNNIKEIVETPFFNLNSLEILDLSHNRIHEIEDLFDFELEPSKLRKLSLSHNRIEDLPEDAFSQLAFLVELDLSYNNISDLTMEPFANLTSLEILRLNNNSIINLNGAVNYLPNLKHLYLRGNMIENIDPESLKTINHLVTFDISKNNLDGIKPMLFLRHWKHLEGHSICKIILADNHIVSIPNGTSKEISTRYVRQLSRARNLDVLTEVDLSKNQISTIEYNAFQSLVQLTSLDLSKNKIIDFVVNSDHLTYVTYLNLSGNFIFQLYLQSFSRMHNLQNLDLSYNKLDYISQRTFDNNNNLKHVNMTFNSLAMLNNIFISSFHPEGGALDLSNNGLTQLRIPYGEGLRLTDLILHSNNITDPSLIDLCYGQRDLKFLDLSKNYIRELNENSLRLPVSLKNLDLSFNLIEKIGPSSFMRVGHLNTLRLSYNQLTTIEYGAFRGLSSLSNLDLAFNRIGILDSKLFMDLKSLSILTVRHNEISLIYDQAWYAHKINLKVYLDENNFTCEWLAGALKNYYNGFSKMWPAVLRSNISEHSLDGIPCTPENKETERLMESPEVFLTDERLLLTTQKILEAVREQTYFLKKYVWRSIQNDELEKSKFLTNTSDK